MWKWALLGICVVGAALLGTRKRDENDDVEIVENAIGATELDECDPLDPESWGEGYLCIQRGARWIAVKKAEKATLNWPCHRPYRGYCIDIHKSPPFWVYDTHYTWDILDQNGKLVYHDTRPLKSKAVALQYAYEYVDGLVG